MVRYLMQHSISHSTDVPDGATSIVLIVCLRPAANSHVLRLPEICAPPGYNFFQLDVSRLPLDSG